MSKLLTERAKDAGLIYDTKVEKKKDSHAVFLCG
jgi:hypothetical protein